MCATFNVSDDTDLCESFQIFSAVEVVEAGDWVILMSPKLFIRNKGFSFGTVNEMLRTIVECVHCASPLNRPTVLYEFTVIITLGNSPRSMIINLKCICAYTPAIAGKSIPLNVLMFQLLKFSVRCACVAR